MPPALEIPAPVRAKLDALDAEFASIDNALNDPILAGDHRKAREFSIRRAALEPIVSDDRRFRSILKDLSDCRDALAGPDKDLAAFAAGEIPALESAAAELLAKIKASLVQSDDRRVGSVIMELRAGTGGDEAALWCRDLLEMYQKYATKRGWSLEPLELTTDPAIGGLRSAVVNIKGDAVWSELSFEAGVHSVKRVPATETQGRIHTSTASVAVLPEPDEVSVKIDWGNDVEEFATRAQGPGGQNVNKVETAWQIHHKPSGIIIKMMEAKSQQQNRERARRLLAVRLHEAERQRQHAERSAARRSQIGGGERSEKIRTYRWKEGIVADERLPGEYSLRDLLEGRMDKIITDLLDLETQRRLAEL
jgi:peptide chain release factor 1